MKTPRLDWIRVRRLAMVLAAYSVLVEPTPASAAEPPGVAQVRSTETSHRITAANVRPHIEYLAGPELQGRGRAQRRQAAEYLRDQFQQFGLRPLFDETDYFQIIPNAVRAKGSSEAAARVMGINVGGWLPGSDPQLRDEFVIISAHYDHLGVRGGVVYPGADDNASGVAMMLETARQVAEMPVKPRRSMVFVGFDLEEELLWGSRWFASHPPWELERVKLFITADMIGRSLGDLDLPTVFVLGSECANGLTEVLKNIDVPDGLELARLEIDLIGTRSDYGPFRDRRIPFLFFSTGQHADYHTPRDMIDRVDFGKVANVSDVVLAVALQVANSHETPVWTDTVEPDLGQAHAIHRITELVLAADLSGQRPLGGVQRFFVSQVHEKTARAIQQGFLTEEERVWLTRSSKLLLLSVF